MRDYTNGAEQLKLIRKLIQQPVVQVIWDVNAFYFNSEKTTIKLACISAKPEGAVHDYDEICYSRLLELNEADIY